MIVYCGGFSNSDVLGSAKGWAGAFLFNPKAKEALDKFYAREDTLSLGCLQRLPADDGTQSYQPGTEEERKCYITIHTNSNHASEVLPSRLTAV